MKDYLPVALLVVASAAFAQGLPAFEEVDQNSDGQISQQEAGVVEALDFATADADQDGTIDRSEYQALSQE